MPPLVRMNWVTDLHFFALVRVPAPIHLLSFLRRFACRRPLTIELSEPRDLAVHQQQIPVLLECKGRRSALVILPRSPRNTVEFADTITIAINHPDKGLEIRYTLDQS